MASLITSSDDGCVLRILTVNDVYEIDYWPHFATANAQKRGSCSSIAPAGTKVSTVSLLPGDFVSPSLLSSLDKGKSMVDCMNLCGIEYICIGNHESDIPLEQLHQRIRESKFEWINSNMPGLPLPPDLKGKLPACKIIEVRSASGSHVRRVALLGLCGEDRSVLKTGAFGGCEIIPLMESLKDYYKKLQGQVDVIIPMTHQFMPLDRALADDKTICVPLVIGGHDHEPYLEIINNCTIVKTGADARNIGICELYWPNKDCPGDKPQVHAVLEPASSFPPDPAVAERISVHKSMLRELEKSVLCPIHTGVEFSSLGMRLRPNTVGTFVCSTLRAAFGTECCLCGAGSIRGNRSYAGEKDFTYAHLKSEIPFDTPIVELYLPGKVIGEMVSFTRQFALAKPPVEKGAYLQTCDAVQWDASTNTVTHIAGAPLEGDRMYHVCMNVGMLEGLDNVVPLLEYKKSRPSDDANIHKTAESGINAKEAIVSYFSKSILINLIKSAGGFEALDANGDGFICLEELRTFCLSKSAQREKTTEMLISNLFGVADINGDGLISKSELLELSLAISNIRFPSHRLDDVLSISEIAAELKQNSAFCGLDDDAISKMMKEIDEDGNGFISRSEFKQFMTKLEHSSNGKLVI